MQPTAPKPRHPNGNGNGNGHAAHASGNGHGNNGNGNGALHRRPGRVHIDGSGGRWEQCSYRCICGARVYRRGNEIRCFDPHTHDVTQIDSMLAVPNPFLRLYRTAAN